MKFSRRKFLGVSCALSSYIYSCRWKEQFTGTPNSDKTWHEGILTFVNSACSGCEGGCGLTFRLVDGMVVGVSGNELFPVNRKNVCTKVYGAIDSAYSKEMFTSPYIRDKKGGQLRKITWKEGISVLTKKLRDIKKTKPKQLLMLNGAREGSVSALWEQFFESFKSPNFYNITDNHTSLNIITSSFFFGNNKGFGYDFENSSYILSFGAHLYEGFGSSVYNMRAIKATSDKRQVTKVFHIESLSSITAGASDDFIFIKPGTYNMLALGILNVIFQEGRYNKTFIKKYTKNFDQFYDFVVRNFYPSMVSKVTGIEKKIIIKIARDFASAKNQVAVLGDDMSYHSNGISSYLAVMALNISVGRIDKPGGVVFPRDDFYSELKPSKVTKSADYFSSFELSNRVKNGDNPFSLALLYNAEQIFTNPEHLDLKTSVKDIKFVVSFSSYPSFESNVADLILPTNHPLTQKEDLNISFNTAKIYAVKNPVLSIKGIKNTGDIIFKLAQIFQDNADSKFKWNSYEDFLKERAKAVYKSKKGYLFSKEEKTAFQKVLLNDGYHYDDAGNFDDFYEKLIENGGWHEPVYFYNDYNRVLKGKIDFFKKPLSRHYDTLPSYRESKKDYPLFLNIYFPPHYSFGGVSNTNSGNSIRSLRHNDNKDYVAEINHHTSKKFGLKSKSTVIIKAVSGSVKMRLNVNDGVADDVVNIEIPQADYLFNIKNVSKNEKIFNILDLTVSTVSKFSAISSTRVSISKA